MGGRERGKRGKRKRERKAGSGREKEGELEVAFHEYKPLTPRLLSPYASLEFSIACKSAPDSLLRSQHVINYNVAPDFSARTYTCAVLLHPSYTNAITDFLRLSFVLPFVNHGFF